MGRTPRLPRSEFLLLLRRPAFIRVLAKGGLQAAARELHLSARTLRRRFQDEETPVRGVVRSHRRAMLRALLLAAVPAREIAAELGFATVQSLNRFSRIEFGMPFAKLRCHLLALEPESLDRPFSLPEPHQLRRRA